MSCIALVIVATLFYLMCCCRAASLLGKLGSAISTATSEYEQAKKLYDKGKSIYDDATFAKNVFNKCAATGAADSFCTVMAGACLGSKKFLKSAKIAGVLSYDAVLPSLENLCLDEPLLKCCKSEISPYCHSAYNSPKPINCEGNEAYGKAHTSGLCVAPCPTCPGCVCDYLQECALPVVDTRRQASNNRSRQLQMDQWFIDARRGSAVQAMLITIGEFITNTSSDAMRNYLTFQGCKGWLNILSSIEYEHYELQTFDGRNVTRNDSFQTSFDAFKTFQFVAFGRLVQSVPNFWNRSDYVMGILWSSEDREQYMSHLNQSAEQELRKYLSPIGLQLLQYARPMDWDMLAVPLQNETMAITTDVDACSMSLLPELVFSITIENSTVSVDISVTNSTPEWMVISIDWGDSVLVDHFVVPQLERLYFNHTFTKEGNYSMLTRSMNSDGMQTEHVHQLEVLSLSLTNDASNNYTAIVNVTMNVTAQGTNEGGGAGTLHILFDASSSRTGDYSRLGYTSLATITNDDDFYAMTLANYTIVLEWEPIVPIFSLRVTCRSVDHYLYAKSSLLIGNIILQVYTSLGMKQQFLSATIVDAVNLYNSTSIVQHDDMGRVLIPCSRRGKEIEDDEEIIELFLSF